MGKRKALLRGNLVSDACAPKGFRVSGNKHGLATAAEECCKNLKISAMLLNLKAAMKIDLEARPL